jgi:hypothetical protein
LHQHHQHHQHHHQEEEEENSEEEKEEEEEEGGARGGGRGRGGVQLGRVPEMVPERVERQRGPVVIKFNIDHDTFEGACLKAS